MVFDLPVQGDDDLVALVQVLVRATTADEIALAVAQRGAAAVGADFANLAMFNAPTNSVRVVHAATLDAGIAARWSEFPISARTPLCEAILTGLPVLVGSLDALAARFPEVASDAASASLPALASVPLSTPVGTLGALGAAWSEPQAFLPSTLHRVQIVADLVAEALHRATTRQQLEQRADTMQAVAAELLQRAFLPPELPHTDHLDVAAAYLPAAGDPMGGDWYDVFPLGDGRTCVVIGDVAGHGVDAVATMAQLRNAIRAFAGEDPRPGRVLARANRMLRRSAAETIATAIVAVWDPATMTFTRANAGHPPVLRCRPGEFAYLDPPRHPVLGAVASQRYREEAKVLRPGTTLVFYTDGLIETRRSPLDHEMQQLLERVQSLYDLSPQVVCDSVVEWRRGRGPLLDDVCVVAARLA